MKTRNLILHLVLLSVLISIKPDDAKAIGTLFCRPRWSDVEYNQMWIKSVHSDVEIQGQIAVTYVDQTFLNEMTSSVEAVFIFPLPENAVITEMIYWFNGERYVAEIKEREEAVTAYNEKLRQWLDPALLEYLGDNLFRLKIVPVNANTEVRTEITYVEMLNYDFGEVNYKFLLNSTGLSPKPLNSVLLNIDATAQSPYKSFTSPTHSNSSATQVSCIADNHYSVLFGDENFLPNTDFKLTFETIRDDVQFDIYTYTPVPADDYGTDSFYALWITPPDQVTEYEAIPKDIVFTADVSSSMEGTRIEQVKESLGHFLNYLNPKDRFNIITFGTVVEPFQPDLVQATADNIEAAQNFVFRMAALGLTNISEALNVSLAQSFGDSTSNNLVFLTDGYPTWGETRIDSIVTRATRENQNNVRLFAFGVGEDLSKSLLIQLARKNNGYPKFITEDDSISQMVENHFNRISKPVMTDLEVDLGSLSAWDTYPKQLLDLYWGSQTMQLGLYTNSGTFPVTLNGFVSGEATQYSKNVYFGTVPGGHRFVPRLWAKAKIDNLLEMIDLYGELDELVNQVIDLSLRFQILTEYTAFYADPDDPNTAVEEPVLKPERFTLCQNFPNPFNPTTQINYTLPSQGHVKLMIYDIQGRLIRLLVDEEQTSGSFQIMWDGKDAKGQLVAAGVYIYKMQWMAANGETKVLSRKMNLVK